MPQPNAPSPLEYSLHAKARSEKSWAQTDDRSARTAPARAASPADPRFFEKQVDPDGVLDPADRARRAGHARKAYYARLALKSARSRRKAREAREAAERLDREAAAAEAALDAGDPA